MRYLFQQGLLRSQKRRVIAVIAILCVLVLVSVALGRTIRARMQSSSTRAKKDALVEQVENSPDSSLTIEQDQDAPLKILAANVKEISQADYERLTLTKSDLLTVVSAPEVRLLNVSNKTVSRVMLIINDVSAQKSTGISMRNLSIAPGTAFTIGRENFVKPETLTTVDERGQANSTPAHPMKSKNFWLPFPDKSKLHVRVGVEFDDGSKWYNKNQRG